MHKNTIIAIVAGVVAACCGLLESYEIAPSFKVIYKNVEAPCFGFLVYYLIWRKRNSLCKVSPPSPVWKLYSMLLQAVGWIFVVAGVVLLLFALSRIFDSSLQGSRSGDWDGVSMSVFAIVVGAVAIMITKIIKIR